MQEIKTKIIAERYHDISCGHRVVGHESKCKLLHGHNYRFHFAIEAPSLDAVGRVMDFGVIKSTICEWLENNFDHKFLIWANDPFLTALNQLSPESLVIVPFNPTAENIGEYIVTVVAPPLLEPYDCKLVSCKIEETRKCSVTITSETK